MRPFDGTPYSSGASLGDAARAGQPTKVTVVVLCRNQAEYTSQCLRSVLRHTREPFDVICVDNGSTDDTSELLANLVDTHANIKVIKNTENIGYAAANNQGIAAAQSGSTIVLLNNDVIVTSGWLDGLLGAFQGNPLLGIVGPRSNYVSGPQRVQTVTYSSDAELDAFARKFRAINRGALTELPKVVGFCMAIRRTVIDTIGGLDERFFPGNFEDDDYCLRARLAGFRVAMVGDVFVHHYGSRTFVGEKLDHSDAMLANWSRYKAKWSLPSDLPIGRPYSLAAVLKKQFDRETHYESLSPHQGQHPTVRRGADPPR